MPKINNKYYMQIIIKYKNSKDIYMNLKDVVDLLSNNKKITLDIDFNPRKI